MISPTISYSGKPMPCINRTVYGYVNANPIAMLNTSSKSNPSDNDNPVRLALASSSSMSDVSERSSAAQAASNPIADQMPHPGYPIANPINTIAICPILPRLVCPRSVQSRNGGKSGVQVSATSTGAMAAYSKSLQRAMALGSARSDVMTNKPAPVASSPVTLNLPDEATLVDRVTNDQTASVANPRLMTIWLERNSGWMLKSNVLPNARKTWSTASASINAGAKASRGQHDESGLVARDQLVDIQHGPGDSGNQRGQHQHHRRVFSRRDQRSEKHNRHQSNGGDGPGINSALKAVAVEDGKQRGHGNAQRREQEQHDSNSLDDARLADLPPLIANRNPQLFLAG